MRREFPSDALAAVIVYGVDGQETAQSKYLGGPEFQDSLELNGILQLLDLNRQDVGLYDLKVNFLHQHLVLGMRPFSGGSWADVAVVDPGKGMDIVSDPRDLMGAGRRIVVTYGDPERTSQQAYLAYLKGRKVVAEKFDVE